MFALASNKFTQRAILITSAYVGVFALLYLTLSDHGQLPWIALRLLYILPILAAFMASAWASLYSTSYKRLWGLMAIGMFCWSAGELTRFGYALMYGESGTSSKIADIFMIAYVPIILAVLLSLGKIKPPFDNEKKQFLTNITLVSLAMLLLCFKFIIAPGWFATANSTLTQKIFATIYPVFDWIVFVSLLFALNRFREGQIEGWLVLLITAFSYAIASDVAYYIFGEHKNIITRLFLVIASISITLSALDEVKGYFIGVIPPPKSRTKNVHADCAASQSHLHTLVIPLLAAAVIPTVWLAYYYNGYKPEIVFLGSGSTIILMLLIYRNHLLISENAILFEKALRDSLTGLNNHRYFQEALRKSISKTRKSSKGTSLLILDIDDFSKINDKYGHVFGDKVLVTIGNAILSKVRENDEACRLSSDEYGIILPRTNESEAYAIAEETKNYIDKTLRNTFPDRKVTVTIGISTYPTLAKSKDDLLHTADGALYWGKLHGKDSILVYDPKVVEVLSAEERAQMVEEAALVDMVRSLASAVDARDPYTRMHSKGVSTMAAKLATQLGLDATTISRMEVAGILHDVGKIGVPDQILNKPGRLTDEEMDVIKTHPALSAQIINSTSLKDIVPAVMAHHERWDGNGYPAGLKGDEIPLEARILAIADTFDAMTTDRPYRKGMSVKDALCELKRCAGSQFDTQLIDAFLAMFNIDLGPDESQTAQSEIKLDKAAGL